MRRRAGRLGAEHAAQAMSGGFGPVYDLVVVAALMRMRRNARTPDPRSDRTLTARVPGAEITINRSRLAARSPGGGIALALEGPWDDRAAARLADAMLRDLAPAGRHLTRTTEPPRPLPQRERIPLLRRIVVGAVLVRLVLPRR